MIQRQLNMCRKHTPSIEGEVEHNMSRGGCIESDELLSFFHVLVHSQVSQALGKTVGIEC